MSRSLYASFNAQNAPILITGPHRSGSTWVGRTLALDPDIGYLHEPFRPDLHGDLAGPRIRYWNRYITEENEEKYVERFSRTLRFDYNLSAELRAVGSSKDVLRMGRDIARFAYHRLRGARPLVKDPGAFFSAEWLAQRFDMAVVVLIRHPAAFAGSLKRMNWTYDGFEHFLKQPLFLRDHLAPFEDEIRAFAHEKRDVVDQAILLWRIFIHLTNTFKERHPNWIFARHEDLSRRPVEAFRTLYRQLDLNFTSKIEETIRERTRPNNPRDAPDGIAHQMERDSRANIWTWKDRLTDEEIKRIRTKLSEVARPHYEETDW